MIKTEVCCSIGSKAVLIQVKKDTSFIEQSLDTLRRHIQAIKGISDGRGHGERATPLRNIEDTEETS